jgi:uncharacterized protein YndB with AHSA1/START domain
LLKKILVILLALIAGFAVFVAIQPGEYAVARTVTIPGSPATVFGVVNNFREFNKWSPWAKIDPNMTTTYSGADTGVGSVYEWQGNADVGKGKMTITESKPYEQIAIRLEFFEPFASVADTAFLFRPSGENTEVTWQMNGKNGFAEKAITLFMDMEGMIGKDFEKGLSQLSDVVKAMPTEEPEPAPAPAAETPKG